MKKKVTIVVVIVLGIVLIAVCVMWRIGGVETESALGDHQKYVYAYVSSIEGNEVTYMEVPEALDSAMSEVRRSLELGKGRTDIIGCYFKNVSTLPQYTKLSFLDSMNLFNQGKSITEAVTTTEKRNILPRNEEVYVNMVDDFVVTNDITDLFGEGYTKSQYRKMKKKFDKLGSIRIVRNFGQTKTKKLNITGMRKPGRKREETVVIIIGIFRYLNLKTEMKRK